MLIILRNVLIFAGLGAGGFLGIRAAIATHEPKTPEARQTANQSPIVLNTASPPIPRLVQLRKPLALDSSFGRMELTGEKVTHIPRNPLHALSYTREWDVALVLAPPKPPVDLPPAPPEDEVREPKPADIPESAFRDLSDLPRRAQTFAQAGIKALTEGIRIYREAMTQRIRYRERGELLADAARYFRDARDSLLEALEFSPDHRVLLRLIQETKANLYAANKR